MMMNSHMSFVRYKRNNGQYDYLSDAFVTYFRGPKPLIVLTNSIFVLQMLKFIMRLVKNSGILSIGQSIYSSNIHGLSFVLFSCSYMYSYYIVNQY